MHPVGRWSQEVYYLLVVESDERGDSTNQDECNIIPWWDGVSVFKIRWLPTDKTIRVATRTSIESTFANRRLPPSKVLQLHLASDWVFWHQANGEVLGPYRKQGLQFVLGG